jgi:excisionase family DNA binding protein
MEFYTVKQFAERLGVSKQRIFERLGRGEIKATLQEFPTKVYLIPVDELKNWKVEMRGTRRYTVKRGQNGKNKS